MNLCVNSECFCKSKLKDLNRHLIREDIQMANKHEKGKLFFHIIYPKGKLKITMKKHWKIQ